MIDNISWLAIYPEILLLVMTCVIALVDLGVTSARRTPTYVLTLLTLAVVAVLAWMMWPAASPPAQGPAQDEQAALDAVRADAVVREVAK